MGGQKKPDLLYRLAKYVLLLILAPSLTAIVEMLSSSVDKVWHFSCVDGLAVSVGVSVTCVTDALASKHKRKYVFITIMVTAGVIAFILFCLKFTASLWRDIKSESDVGFFVYAALNAVISWVLSFELNSIRAHPTNQKRSKAKVGR
jgi:hypothetical protein